MVKMDAINPLYQGLINYNIPNDLMKKIAVIAKFSWIVLQKVDYQVVKLIRLSYMYSCLLEFEFFKAC